VNRSIVVERHAGNPISKKDDVPYPVACSLLGALALDKA
jgi:hypothetical protein